MKLLKKIIHKKLNQAELIEMLEKLEFMKAKAIKNQQYEFAAQLRDDERKYREQLEDMMNSISNEENGNPQD
jgi:protein-arginine kinase activator protein McsA